MTQPSGEHAGDRLLRLSTWTDLPPSRRGAAAAALSDVEDAKALEVVLVETWLILHQLQLEAIVSARVKSPESLAAKAKRKRIDSDAVLDRLALRIRLDEQESCYAVLDRICTRWPPFDESFDDYIADPKSNGYQSLHIAVNTVFGAVEFQIRTHAMHHHAETGGASHWVYKARQRGSWSPGVRGRPVARSGPSTG